MSIRRTLTTQTLWVTPPSPHIRWPGVLYSLFASVVAITLLSDIISVSVARGWYIYLVFCISWPQTSAYEQNQISLSRPQYSMIDLPSSNQNTPVGNVHRLSVNNMSSFAAKVSVVKPIGSVHRVGEINPGERATFDLSNVEGIHAGDDIHARVTSNAGSEDSDSARTTYSTKATIGVSYAIAGTEEAPRISFQTMEP
ncbi:hypothetical protein HGRIS_001950 [Hohenbuehelia grisea]|uniref:Uncharacterized protein n=1 Tax=Hohenbuehelia grisea TaxID=104357 RepID=A0ABR3JKA1_9AGAR